MKSMAVYSSQTGNTRKLAEAVAQELPGETELFAVDQAPDPEGYDLVALAFWFQGGGPDPKSAAFLPTVKDGDLILLATHGAAVGSQHVADGLAKAAALAGGATVKGSFSCLGEVNPKALAKISAKPQPPAWINDAPKAQGHPDEEDILKLRAWARETLAP